MNGIIRILVSIFVVGLWLPAPVSAQGVQVLKDEWIASSVGLHKIERFVLNDGTIVESLENRAIDLDSPNFRAIALEDVSVASVGELSRNVIAVDESEHNRPLIYRFRETEDGGTDMLSGTVILDAAAAADFRFVTTIAVSSDGARLWFNGYSRRKRQYELWTCSLDPTVDACGSAQPVINGNPQLTESVYLNGADVPDTLLQKYDLLQDGGLIGVTDREVLFFHAGIEPDDEPLVLAEIRNISSVRNSTKILSAAFARNTPFLTLALSTREVISIDLSSDTAIGAPLSIDANSALPGCEDDRSQLLRIRNLASADGNSTSVVTDSTCRVIHRYTVLSSETSASDSVDTRLALDPDDADAAPDLLALAVGEGTFFRCEDPECTFTPGFTAEFDTTEVRDFLSRKVNNLCDPRVNPVTCPFETDIDEYGRLEINPQLPQDMQDSLEASSVTLFLPAHLFSTSANGRFGALFVDADAATSETLHEASLEIGTLSENGMPELDVAIVGDPDFENFAASLLEVFNNDVVAYAPDNPDQPSIDSLGNPGFEATPATIGRGSTRKIMRGYSVVFYGLQDDLYLTSPRVVDNGDPTDPDYVPVGGIASLGTGSATVCDTTLVYGNQQEFATADNDEDGAYFMNLAACLFNDLRTLALHDLVTGAVDSAYLSTYLQLVASQLTNLEDKLGKGLSEAVPSASPNAGDTNFGAIYSQLENLRTDVLETPFDQVIYQNDLLARIRVLEFTLLNRTEPSIGF